jgi:hypothetical protein
MSDFEKTLIKNDILVKVFNAFLKNMSVPVTPGQSYLDPKTDTFYMVEDLYGMTLKVTSLSDLGVWQVRNQTYRYLIHKIDGFVIENNQECKYKAMHFLLEICSDLRYV